MRRTRLHFHLLILNNLLSTMIHIYHIQICHIIQNHKISLTSGRDHTKLIQPITSCRLYRCHLQSLFNRKPQLHRTLHIIINMPLFTDFLNMLIIRTETKTGSIRMMLHNSLHNRIQIPRRTSLTDKHLHTISRFSHCIFIIHTLMICINPTKHIRRQITRRQKRCMTILHSVPEQMKLLMHGNTSINH